MSLRVKPFSTSDAFAWDAFCKASLQATFLHTRGFLSYHGDRFSDCSLIIENNGKWLGILPAALKSGDDKYVVSHPGITYGGIVHQGGLRGERMVEALTEILRYYRSQGHEALIYKAVPTFYHSAPAADDLYGLFRLGAIRTRCDLSSAIDLKCRLPLSERRRRGLKKAKMADVEISEGIQNLPELWDVLAKNLESKHDVKPAHTLHEIGLLAERFPEHIRCVCAILNEQVVAGTVLFVSHTTHHAQYIASSPKGYEVAALDLVFDHAIDRAFKDGKRWFDFGISTERQGNVLNDGLYRFKTEFGGGGFVHEFYEIDLFRT